MISGLFSPRILGTMAPGLPGASCFDRVMKWYNRANLYRPGSNGGRHMHQDTPLIQEYISQAITTEYKLVNSRLNHMIDIPSQEITIQIDEDDVETSAFGIMYSISLLSFLQGRPAGVSVVDYQEQDVWSTEDFHRHLSFRLGKLRFDADYVRGRLIKTVVEISKDGTLLIKTRNRADLATQWLEYLLGKRSMLDFISGKALGTVQ